MKPTLELLTGEPAGIGPEIVAKVLADQEVLQAANLLIIGSRPVLEKGMQAAGVATELPLAPSTLPDGDHEPLLIQCAHVEAATFEQGQVTPKDGKFMLAGLALGLQLCQQNIAAAMFVAQFNKTLLRA